MVNRIIVPLDGMAEETVLTMIGKLRKIPGVACFKFNDAWDDVEMGPRFFALLKDRHPDLPIWIDTKLKDIPNTMTNRVAKTIHACRPRFLTVMGDNTIEAMRAAMDAAKGTGTAILAVTVLTSMNEEDCNDIYGAPVKAKVLRFARNAALAGVDGIVCSPKELEFLKKYPELNGLKMVTPGIRPEWAQKGDQKRVTTPPRTPLKWGQTTW